MDEIDKLLAEIKAEQLPQAKLLKSNIPQSDASIDRLLDVVKADYQQQDKAEEIKKQQELQQIKQQKVEALKNQAIAWLQNLDPLSSEGIWFESFAEKYPSKLEAAIDYLCSLIEKNYPE